MTCKSKAREQALKEEQISSLADGGGGGVD
jgi:hypothetical protein